MQLRLPCRRWFLVLTALAGVAAVCAVVAWRSGRSRPDRSAWLADAQVYEKLQTVTSVCVTDVPLEDVLKQLAERHGLAIVFEEEDFPADSDTRWERVSWDIPEIRLVGLLELIRLEFSVAYHVRDGAVVVSRWDTRRESDEPNCGGSVYPVPPPSLISGAFGEAALHELLDIVPLNKTPRPYATSFLPPSAAVVLESTGNRHQEQLLAEIERTLERPDHTQPILARPRDPLCRRIVERLTQRTSLTLTGVTLGDVGRRLQQWYGITTVVDRQAVWSGTLDAEARLSVAIRDEPLWAALEQLRRQVGLEYAVANDVLWLGDATGRVDNSIVQAYPVADLLGGGRRFSSRGLVGLVTLCVEPVSERLYDQLDLLPPRLAEAVSDVQVPVRWGAVEVLAELQGLSGRSDLAADGLPVHRLLEQAAQDSEPKIRERAEQLLGGGGVGGMF